MKNAALAVLAAAGVFVAALPEAALAGDRPAHKPYSQYKQYSQAPQSYRADGGAYERKCMTLPCGTRWCYNVRR